MKSIFIFFATLFLYSGLLAQPFGLNSVAHLRDSLADGDIFRIKSIQKDAAENLYIGGVFAQSADFDPSSGEAICTAGLDPKTFMAKYDPAGALVWVKTIGKIAGQEISAMVVDAAGNVYITGVFRDRFFYDPANRDSALDGVYVGPAVMGWATSGYLAKYDTDGNVVWARKMTSNYKLNPKDVHVSASGNILVTGSLEGSGYFASDFSSDTLTSAGLKDIFVAQYTVDGHFSWANRIGGAQQDEGLKIGADQQDNIYLVAAIKGSVDVDPGPGNHTVQESSVYNYTGGNIVLKLTGAGAFQWCNFYGDIGGIVKLSNLTLTSSGNVALTGKYRHLGQSSVYDFDLGPGTTTSPAGSSFFRPFAAVYDGQGQFEWVEDLDKMKAEGASVISGPGDTLFVVGSLENSWLNSTDGFLAKCGPNGGLLYSHSIVSTEGASQVDVCLTADGRPVTTGQYSGIIDLDASSADFELVDYATSNGLQTAVVCEFDTQGYPLWAIRLSDNTNYRTWNDYASLLETDSLANVFIRGVHRGATDFDPGSAEQFLTSDPLFFSEKVFIAKYDSLLQYEWSFQYDSVELDAIPFAVDQGGNAYVGVNANGTVELNPLGPSEPYVPYLLGGVLVKYDPSGNMAWNIQFEPIDSPNGRVLPYQIAVNDNGIITVTGSFSGTVDFDPGPDTNSLSVVGPYPYNPFMAMYDTAGNYIWAKVTPTYQILDLAMSETDEIFVTGKIMGSVDLDLGPGTNIIQGGGTSNIFLAKYDPGGNLLWGFSVGDTVHNEGLKLAIGENHVYLLGDITYGCDFDPGPGVQEWELAGAIESAFLARYRSNTGELDWVIAYDTNSTEAISIDIDDQENIILLGEFGNSVIPYEVIPLVDFDPVNDAVGFSSMESSYDFVSPDLFIAMYDSTGAYLWASPITGQDWKGGDIKFNKGNDQLVVAGGFRSISDFAPGNAVNIKEATNGIDIFMATYGTCFPTYSTINATACGSYSMEELVYTASGTYIDTIANHRGCDSIVTLQLTILPDFTNVSEEAACGSFTWSNGQTYQVSGQYIQNLSSQTGCDSIQVLNLTIYPLDTVEMNVDACEPYTWIDGQTYSASGEYYHTLSSVHGCDSVTRLNLVVHPTPAAISVQYDGTGIMAWGTPGTTYQWINCATLQAVPNQTGWYFIPTEVGSFAVVYSNGTCSDTSTCVYIDHVGLQTLGEAGIKGFPNPVTDAYHLSFGETLPLINIEVSDVRGNLLFKEIYTDVTEIKIPVDWAPGTYLLRILDDCCLIGLERLVVVRD